MIGRSFRWAKVAQPPGEEPQGFDAFELRLGDVMRGERATMGKSLLDVQRELKIKAAYIAAIENADPSAFDTPGFIAGYVRSYARYLNMDADWAFETFCRESGFATAHGMSAAASSVQAARDEREARNVHGRDIFSASATPFIPAGERLFSGVEPRAIGSIMVLVALIGGLGYGGYSVLQEVQRVQMSPVEQAPTVISVIDPLAGSTQPDTVTQGQVSSVVLPSAEALDRLYRPQALDVPVLVARDGPIVTLDRSGSGTLGITDPSLVAQGLVSGLPNGQPAPQDGAQDGGASDIVTALIAAPAPGPVVRVTEGPLPELAVVAVREAWVRVRAADGTTLFELTMQPGDSYIVPALEEPASLRVGESGAIYFAVNGTPFGPAGARGQVSTVALDTSGITETYTVADLTADAALAEIVNVAELSPVAETGASSPEGLPAIE